MSLVSLGDNRKSRNYEYKCDEIKHGERSVAVTGGEGLADGRETLKGKATGTSQVGRNGIET